ncbi:MAG TPA: xanthine dehydrogenase family protein subunit M [Thermaerobacter sp.]
MKPPRFEYRDPRTLQEAVELLAGYGDEAKILAGGQSLVPMLNMRLARPSVLIDINRIPGLDYIRVEEGRVVIGALARHRVVERSQLVRRHCPLLAEALRWVGHPAIRHRGTVCGSLAHADPAAELPAVLAALEGEVRVAGPHGERRIPFSEFFLTYFTTSLDPTEMVVEASFPVLPPDAGWAFQEVARRHGDFALVGVAAVLRLDAAGVIREARLALTGVDAVPVRARAAEEALVGRRPGDEVWREAAALVGDGIQPESDLHASAAYRKHVAGVLAGRALREAAARAGGERT